MKGRNLIFTWKKNYLFYFYFQYAEENQIPLVILVGESEIEGGVVKIRVTETREELIVKKEELVQKIREQLKQLSNS